MMTEVALTYSAGRARPDRRYPHKGALAPARGHSIVQKAATAMAPTRKAQDHLRVQAAVQVLPYAPIGAMSKFRPVAVITFGTRLIQHQRAYETEDRHQRFV